MVSKTRATLIASCTAVLVAQLTNALPGALNGTFQQEFQTAGTELTWITAAFMIPLVVFELTFGLIGDMWGRKKLLIGGAGLLVAGALVCATAPTVQAMWAGQALSGLGAGILFPISLTLSAAITPTAHARARVIAIWAGFLSLGAAISPLLAGLFAEYSSWRGAYIVVAVLAAVAALLTLGAQDSSAPSGRKVDIPGQVTLALGLIAVLYAAVQGAEVGWSRPEIVGGFVAGAALLAAFVVIELRTDPPLLDLRLFRNRSFSIASVVAVVGMFSFLGICFSTSIWLGAVQHQSALKIGILFLFIQGPAFALIPLISYLLRHVPPRWVLTGGFALMAVGGFWCSRFDVQDLGWTRFIAPLLLVGIGFALTVGSITAVAINTVPLHYAGMASATTNLLRDLGFALGPVIVGAIALSSAGARFAEALPGSGLPPAELGAATAIGEAAGPIAVNSLPPGVPGSGAHAVAMDALGSGFQLAFLVCAIGALVAAALTLFGLRNTRDTTPEEQMMESAQSFSS
ncbi:MFS transporter [Actinoplanes sp. NBC_00393]|uniref:MFS transporter n=1 Tax=Actinoplanes sp. NBC_00393 TaxID=2975953 RepID=UPI002E1E5168